MSADDLNEYIRGGESQRVEFKQELSKAVIESLPKQIAGMANTEGGRIIIGVEDGGRPVGCSLSNDTKNFISQAAQRCSPSVSIDIQEAEFGGMKFPIVEVAPSSTVHSFNNRFPLRNGTVTDYADGPGLVRLIIERHEDSENEEYWPQGQPDRVSLPTVEKQLILDGLSGSQTQILQTLFDIEYDYRHHFHWTRSTEIIHKLSQLIEKGADEVVQRIASLLRFAGRDDSDEKPDALHRLRSVVLSAAKHSDDRNVREDFFNFIAIVSPELLEDIILHWVQNIEDLSHLKNNNLFAYSFPRSMVLPLRTALYPLLELAEKDSVRENSRIILGGLRQVRYK